MKKTILSFIIAVITLFSAVGCTDDPAPLPPPDDGGDVFTLKETYNILYYDGTIASEKVNEAKDYIRTALRDTCDLNTTVSAHASIPEAERYEILIGDTGRAESDELLRDMRYNDYGYRVVSERLIVIAGGSPSATLEATKRFCLDVLGYDGKYDGFKEISVEVGKNCTYKANYKYDALTINGTDARNTVVAVHKRADAEQVSELVDYLCGLTGWYIPVVRYDELDGDESCVICVGSLDRSGEVTLQRANGEHNYKVRIDCDNGVTVGFEAYTEEFKAAALSKIRSAISLKESGTTANLTFSELDEAITDIAEGIPVWTLNEESSSEISDGVLYREQLYYDDNGKPYRVYILEVDPTKNYFYMGTGGDTYEYYPSVMQSTKGHMESAIANGYSVVAGVNADFFNMGETNKPTGIAVKEGEMIALPEWTSRPYYGFTYEGESVIENLPSTAYTQNLRTAVGGSHVIVENSLSANIGPEDYAYGETANPRTLVGVRPDGTVLLVVIDGRQSRHSNGASLARCALLMMELGAESAINLDGGGSSTMITYGEDGYDTKNSPSDGSLRRVYNSILVIKNDENR